MVPFKTFLHFPTKLRERIVSLSTIQSPRIINIDNDGSLTIFGRIKEYDMVVKFIDSNVININKFVQVSCTCPSFNFEFAKTLFKQNALYNPDNFTKTLQLPIKLGKNLNIISGCKHLIIFSQYLFSNQSKIK